MNRLVAVAILFAVALFPSGTTSALPKDGTDPTACASPQTVRARTIPANPGIVLTVQLRFSDPCDIVWTRMCYNGGYKATAIRTARPAGQFPAYSDTRFRQARVLANPITSSFPFCSSNAYSYGYGVEDDCMEDYGVSCVATGFGRITFCGAQPPNCSGNWETQTDSF